MSDFAKCIDDNSLRGFGTYQIKDPIIIKEAIKNGYNFFDTAELYRNEKIIADILKNTKTEKDLFVSTKLSYIAIEKNEIEKSFYGRLEMFQGLKINLLLLHKPSDDCKRDWTILNNLYQMHRDRIDHIGVSNYEIRHLEQIKDTGFPMPFVNQIELSPFHTRTELVDYCRSIGTIIVSHTTLTRNVKTDNPILASLANKYNTNNVTVLLKWAIQNGYITIPRTSIIEHLVENYNANKVCFDFSDSEMILLNNLNEEFSLTKIRF
jgi:diketogulonate reductase-like aldo/keto reductase